MYEDERLLDVQQVAARYGVHRTTVWRWRERGALPPPVTIGRVVRWRPDDLDEFERENAREGRR